VNLLLKDVLLKDVLLKDVLLKGTAVLEPTTVCADAGRARSNPTSAATDGMSRRADNGSLPWW
jgi:hypothetical protein